MLVKWWTDFSVKNLILQTIWTAFTTSFLKKIILFLYYEHVFPNQERHVLCRGINGTATSVPQERAPALRLQADGPTEVMDLWLCLHSGTTASTSCLGVPVILCISFCKDFTNAFSSGHVCVCFGVWGYSRWSVSSTLYNCPIILGCLLEIESFSLHPYPPGPLKTGLSVQVWSCLKIQPIEMVHACNPSTWKTKVGGSWFQSKPKLHSRTLSGENIQKPECQETKKALRALVWQSWVYV